MESQYYLPKDRGPGGAIAKFSEIIIDGSIYCRGKVYLGPQGDVIWDQDSDGDDDLSQHSDQRSCCETDSDSDCEHTVSLRRRLNSRNNGTVTQVRQIRPVIDETASLGTNDRQTSGRDMSPIHLTATSLQVPIITGSEKENSKVKGIYLEGITVRDAELHLGQQPMFPFKLCSRYQWNLRWKQPEKDRLRYQHQVTNVSSILEYSNNCPECLNFLFIFSLYWQGTDGVPAHNTHRLEFKTGQDQIVAQGAIGQDFPTRLWYRPPVEDLTWDKDNQGGLKFNLDVTLLGEGSLGGNIQLEIWYGANKYVSQVEVEPIEL